MFFQDSTIAVRNPANPDQGEDVAVKPDDDITYEISYKNYKSTAATVTITDKLDRNVTYKSSEPAGEYDEGTHTVTWTIPSVDAETTGSVELVVTVLENAKTAGSCSICTAPEKV